MTKPKVKVMTHTVESTTPVQAAVALEKWCWKHGRTMKNSKITPIIYPGARGTTMYAHVIQWHGATEFKS